MIITGRETPAELRKKMRQQRLSVLKQVAKGLAPFLLLAVAVLYFVSPWRRGFDTDDVAKEMEQRYSTDVYVADYGKPDGVNSMWSITERANREVTFYAWSMYERRHRTGGYVLHDNRAERLDLLEVLSFAEDCGIDCSAISPDMTQLRYGNTAYTVICTYRSEDTDEEEIAREAVQLLNRIGEKGVCVDFQLQLDGITRIDLPHGLNTGGFTEEGVQNTLHSLVAPPTFP